MQDHPIVLVVDDEPSSINTIVPYLHDAGFKTMVAPSGERALRQIELAQPDIILLDVLMTDMDGFETCRHVKANPRTRDIPVIFMTALSETIDKVKGFEAGGVDYLTKPVHHEEVFARISLHLRLRKLQQQLEEQNARWRTLSEAAFEGILIHAQGRIIEVNQAFEQMFGYPRSYLLDRHIGELVTPTSSTLVARALETSDPTPYEIEGLKQNGAAFPLEMQAKTILYQGGEFGVVAVRDLSWQRAMECEKTRLEKENLALRSTLQDRYKFGEILGKSPAMQEVYQAIVRASASEATVTIYGESGTGKELVALTIHQQSARRQQPFVPVNCGAVPEPLFESEFFGHRKGAFTGADRDKPGFFDRAHGGTLFLDEIGELTPTMQVKLLRVLESGEYTPVGANMIKKADVRIIAATNQNLRERVKFQQIREDFFYRIHVLTITIPPLRERREDLPLLIDHFLKQYGAKNDCTTMPRQIIHALCAYSWPGNVRELQNEIQRYLVEQQLEFLGDLQADDNDRTPGAILEFEQTGQHFREAVAAYEKYLIGRVLAQYQGNIANAANALDLPLRTMYTKVRKYGLA